MTHLQKITTLAKKIRKTKPSMKWTDAIKQASKRIKPAAKKAVPKKAAKKVAGKKYTTAQLEAIANNYAYAVSADLDKVTARLIYHPELVTMYLNEIKKYETRTGDKLSGVKKRIPKKPITKTHKDTKSHNVNIRVVSGVKKPNYKKPTAATNLQHYSWLTGREIGLTNLIAQIKSERPATPAKRAEIASYQKQLKAVKQQKAIQKKLI